MAEGPAPLSSPMSASSFEENLAIRNASSIALNEIEQVSADAEDVPLILEQAPSKPCITKSPLNSTPSKRFPRLNTRSSLSGPSLPWQVDTTSSPSTPSSYGRKASFVPPPRPDTGSYIPQTYSSSPLPQLQPVTPISPSPYRYSTSNASGSGRFVDRSHPPGYTQDSRASFSDRPMYGNYSPFYENNQSSSFSSPMTPKRRGRGILDNDPAIYLSGEGDGEDDTVWDTAAKWARAAGKRLSQGEQQIWKLVSAMGNGDMDQ